MWSLINESGWGQTGDGTTSCGGGGGAGRNDWSEPCSYPRPFESPPPPGLISWELLPLQAYGWNREVYAYYTGSEYPESISFYNTYLLLTGEYKSSRRRSKGGFKYVTTSPRVPQLRLNLLRFCTLHLHIPSQLAAFLPPLFLLLACFVPSL